MTPLATIHQCAIARSPAPAYLARTPRCTEATERLRGPQYLMMVNGTTIIGLFQGLFERNILTFNPGLAQDTSRVEDFSDVRDIRAALVAEGVEMATDTDPDATGPASVVITDPDGNPILIDQFFPRPGG